MGRKKQSRDGELVRTEGGKAVFGGYCKAWPGKGTDHLGEGRCSNHGGAGEGAGAPEGNANGVSHGAYTDKSKLYESEFSERERDLADRVTEDYVERYEDVHGTAPPAGFRKRLFHIGVNSVAELRVENWYTDKPEELDTGSEAPHIDRETRISEDGMRYYRYKKSPAVAAQKHLSRYNHKWLKALGLLPDADQQQADALEGLQDAWKERAGSEPEAGD